MEENIIGAEAMGKYAADFTRALTRGKRAVVVALEGDLGAGKTTFVQGAARSLGVIESITSPTFVIQKIYPLKGRAFDRMIHVDAYRLTGARELEALGWQETLKDPANLIYIEWPERVPEAVPEGAARLHFRFIDEQTRGVRV